MAIELMDHQVTAVGKMKNGCILAGGTGVGKTTTALAYFYERVCGGISRPGHQRPATTPIDLFVLTTARKRDDLDWQQEALPFGISSDVKFSKDGIRLTVDSWNNIAKYAETEGAFFIFDEQRAAGSGAWVKSFLKIAKKNKWIMLSATPGDNWIDYIPVFVANGFYKNRTLFKEQHVVYNSFSKYPKVERYIGEGKLMRLRHDILVPMPYQRHTKQHIHQMIVDYDEDLYRRVFKDRWNPYTDLPILNVSEFMMVARKVVNSDPARIGALMKLMEKHPRLIIFYSFTYELEALRALGDMLGVYYKEWNGVKHEPVPDREKWLYFVQYGAGAEAWNCISTDAMAFFSLQYSYRVFSQSMGRIDRLNTPYTDLHYYLLRSNAPIDIAINKARATKQNFNEKAFAPTF